MKHDNDNDNCDLTIQAVATCWVMDMAHKYGSANPTFHKYFEVVICRLVR